MKNIINLVSCVACDKVGVHWLCSTCEKRIHHPSVYSKVARFRDALSNKLSEVK